MLTRYYLDGVLFHGAQSKIVPAADKTSGARYIVKIGPDVRDEALLCLELNHPYVVAPLDFGVDAEQGPFAVYPEVQGCRLSDICETDQEKFHRTVFQIADFLAFLHHRGRLYNDFKPEHFVIGEQNVQILDLGLCSPLAPGDRVSTYSGTFPYISPERLLGRPHDARSDLFAFGLLLLGAFFPDEVPADAPSIQALSEFHRVSERLRGRWRDLILELTAWEPAQRPASAAEVWRRLVKPAGSRTFLFYPLPFYRTLNPQSFTEFKTHMFSSGSSMELSVLQRQITRAGWASAFSVYSCEILAGTLETEIRKLCHVISGEEAGDFYDAVSRLSRVRADNERWIIFTLRDVSQHKEDSLLSFLLTTLQDSGYRFFLLTTHSRKLMIENYRKWDLPALDISTREKILSQILDDEKGSTKIISGLKGGVTQPEQIFSVFSEHLKHVPAEWWPAAAAACRQIPAASRLSPGERRLLGALQMCGGSICKPHLDSLRPGKTLERLEERGYIREEGNRVLLIASASRSLKSLRKKHVRQIARRLFVQLCPECTQVARYHIARSAGEIHAAADAAMVLATQSSGNAAQEWFCRAFLSGAALPIRDVRSLASKLLVRSRMRMVAPLLRKMKERFGKSSLLADLYLDYYHGRDALDAGLACAERMLRSAVQKSRSTQAAYWKIRLAGLLMVKGEVERGETLLKDNIDATESPSIHGIRQHYLGLGRLLRGDLSAAKEFFRDAIKIRHRFRATTLMNLGITHLYQGDLIRSERYLRAAEKHFVRKQNAERLANVQINLGIVLKRQGKILEARQTYYKALHLSRVSANRRLEASALRNLANLYDDEGRTKLSIEFGQAAARAARKAGLPDLTASCLNNMGLQYAMRGRMQSSLSTLKRSLEIRKKLGLKRGLGATYENLGLAWWMNRKPQRANTYFSMAMRLFAEANSSPDAYRASLYVALCNEIPPGHPPEFDSDFETGLFHHVTARAEMRAGAEPPPAVLEQIHEAEIRFRKAPSLYWLAKTLQLKAEYQSLIYQHEKAWLSYVASHNIFTRLGARQELMGFDKATNKMKMPGDFLDRMAEKLPFRVLQLVRSVLSEPNPDRVIKRILDSSLEFTGMERAVLLLEEDPPRVYMSTSVDEDTIREFREISASATESVSESRKPFIATDADSNSHLNQRPSIIRNRIVSIACLPLQVQERLLGYLYLDSREGVESLATTESTLLDIFAGVVALILNNSMSLEKSLQANESMSASLGLNEKFPEIIGTSAPMLQLLKTVHQLLNNDLPVLITGETGTGKELIARVLHYCGKRREGPFVAINSAALTESLLESEMFGHEKGSFTGAMQTRKGVFEEAADGTLFLDEISEMPRSTQAKFLRVLQDGEFRRVGGSETLRTNARVVLATNRKLEDLVEQKEFRDDLYYRIHGAQLHVPPLRARREDIPVLASHFLKITSAAARKSVRGFSPKAMDILKRYNWPGNVRQLKSEVERIVAFVDHEWILDTDITDKIHESALTDHVETAGNDMTLREAERELIVSRLNSFDWNIQITAKSLGLTRNGLYSKMKLYGISKGSSA